MNQLIRLFSLLIWLLFQIFPNNPKSDDPCVVKDISINFFENQLTAILG